MSNLIKLEKRLNRILDDETEKGYEQADTEIISECSDMLLRMDSAKRYALTADEYRSSVDEIVGEDGAKKVISHKKFTVLLVAAILLLIMAITVTAYELYKADILTFSDHHSIVFEKPNGLRKAGDLTVDCIPEGFVLEKESSGKFSVTNEYHNGDKIIIIDKNSAYESIAVDSEHGDIIRKEIDGTEYIIVGSEDSFFSISWEQGKNLYHVYGNIDLDTLMKTVLTVK